MEQKATIERIEQWGAGVWWEGDGDRCCWGSSGDWVMLGVSRQIRDAEHHSGSSGEGTVYNRQTPYFQFDFRELTLELGQGRRPGAGVEAGRRVRRSLTQSRERGQRLVLGRGSGDGEKCRILGS